MQNIRGLVALVTGGASGYGLATVERLLRDGAKIIMCDLPTSKGEQTAKRLGSNCIFVPTDVTSEADVEKALNVTKTKFQKLDAVVNCAGTNALCKTYDFSRHIPHPLESFVNLIKVNTFGTFNVTRLAVGLISKNKPSSDGQKGVIVNLTSTHAYEGSMGHVAYAASSGCNVAMTLPLARDLASEGIRCCAIATGLFDTPYFQSLPAKYRRYMPSTVPFPKGLGNPDEFAHIVQTVLENTMLNGEVIRLDAALRHEI